MCVCVSACMCECVYERESVRDRLTLGGYNDFVMLWDFEFVM